jgi:hypothetical protein
MTQPLPAPRCWVCGGGSQTGRLLVAACPCRVPSSGDARTTSAPPVAHLRCLVAAAIATTAKPRSSSSGGHDWTRCPTCLHQFGGPEVRLALARACWEAAVTHNPPVDER